MRKSLKTLIVIVIILATNVVTVIVLRPPSEVRQEERVEQLAANVVVQVVTPAPLPDAVLLPATVEPYRSVAVAAETGGSVEEIIDEGSIVEEGQIITRVDTRLLRAELDQARASHELAQSEFRRSENLRAQNAVSQEQFEQAQAQLAVARARLDAAETAFERATVVAPIGGILNERLVDRGEFVNRGDVIARIVQIDPIKVGVDIPEKDVVHMALGSTVGVSTDGESFFPGRVTYRSVVADPRTLTYRAEITVPNGDSRLLPGMIVRVALLRRLIEDAVTVPLFAVVPRNSRAIVYVVNDELAHEREVELGVTDGRNIQITSGLRPGERVVVVGQRQLREGQPVVVVPALETQR